MFQLLYFVKKKVYKLKLQKKQKIDDIFNMLLLQQNITKEDL